MTTDTASQEFQIPINDGESKNSAEIKTNVVSETPRVAAPRGAPLSADDDSSVQEADDEHSSIQTDEESLLSEQEYYVVRKILSAPSEQRCASIKASCWFLAVQIGTIDTRLLVDSGSEVTLLSANH